MNKERLSLDLYDRGLIELVDFTLNSGLWSPVYYNLRPLCSFDHRSRLSLDQQKGIRSRIFEAYSLVVARFETPTTPEHIIGVPEGAFSLTAMAGAIIDQSVLQMRVKEKTHGFSVAIEGSFYNDETVIALDDVLTRGVAFADFVPKVTDAGLFTRGLGVLIDREQGGRQKLETMGLQVESAITVSEIYDCLLDNNRIDKNTHNLLVAYQRGEIIKRPQT